MNGWLPSPINWRPVRSYEVNHQGESWTMTGLFSVRLVDGGLVPHIDSDLHDELIRLPLGATVTNLENGVMLWRAGRPTWFDDSELVEVIVDIPIWGPDGGIEQIDVWEGSIRLPKALLERAHRDPDEPPYGAEFLPFEPKGGSTE